MAALRAVLWLSLAGVWLLAAWLWPQLPDRIPVHFDVAGRPDGWTAKSPVWWFAQPALSTFVVVVLGFGLPRWVVALARAKSRWLNVPDKARFMALPIEARERAMQTPMPWLALLVGALQCLFAWLIYGSARVARSEWEALPWAATLALIALVIGCALGLTLAGVRAVRREVAAAAARR